ncbi:MAG: small multi-drug export protein [Methanobacterium sp.]|nr:small multi-drug export protein [Methanobacterium sp.]
METLYSVFVVFIAGIIELWLAVPLGLVLNLSPLSTAFFSALGSITAALIVTFSGTELRTKFLKWRYGSDERYKKGRIYQIWNRYGIIGLGLLSPLFFGAPLGTALGIILGSEKYPLLLWMILGIVIWSAGLTTAVFLGIITLNVQL